MPESVCLHIQDRESGPIRVVDIPWISVRIGRASFCEVRLADYDLAEEVCRLYRRGRAWQLVPKDGRTEISLEGQRVDRLCALPFDVPFCVGTYRLTLRKDRSAEPDWSMFRTAAPAEVYRSIAVDSAGDAPSSMPPIPHGPPVAAEPIVQSALEAVRRASPAGDVLESGRGSGRAPTRSNEWEARWKAAGAELKARAERSKNGGEAKRPVYERGFEAVPLKEPRVPRARPVAVPEVEPPYAPMTAPVPMTPRGGGGWPAHAVGARRPWSQERLPSADPAGEPDVNSDGREACLEVELVDDGPLAAERGLEAGEGRELDQPSTLRADRCSPLRPLTPDPSPQRGEGDQMNVGREGDSVDAAADCRRITVLPSSRPLTPEPSSQRGEGDRMNRGRDGDSVGAAAGSRRLTLLPSSSARSLTPEPSPQRRDGDRDPSLALRAGMAPLNHELSPQRGEGDRTHTASGVEFSRAGLEHRTVAPAPPSPLTPLPVGARGTGKGEPADENVGARGTDKGEPVDDHVRARGTLKDDPVDDRVTARATGDGEPIDVGGREAGLTGVNLEREPIVAAERPVDVEREQRTPGRGGSGSRRAGLLRPRAGGHSREIESNLRNTADGPNRVEWASAQEILAAHRAIPKPRPATAVKPAGRLQAAPTLARAPEQWNAPAWLAGPPVVLFICAVGLVGSVLSWRWAGDSYTAAIMTDRLMLAGQSSQRRPLPESIVPPAGSWTMSTAQHLAHWAIFLNRNGAADERANSDVGTLLERALEAAPANPTARLAVAQLEPAGAGAAPDVPVRTLGLSRDAVSLSHSAGRLLAAGQRDAALRLYSQALLFASSAEPSRGTVPGFNRDPAIHRYLLPGEERVRDVARALVLATDWKFEDWSRALPRDPTSLVAVARLMRERGRSEAEDLLRQVIEEPPAAEEGTSPRALAARAEALALQSRWKQAAEQYRHAIEFAGDATTRRSWWFNLAEIAQRLDDQTQRDTALRAALASGPSDDITRRAAELQRTAPAPAVVRSTGTKAN
jgi:tetratricopeptide (TPR) repeat protein